MIVRKTRRIFWKIIDSFLLFADIDVYNEALGKALDVRGTPQFFVNDRRVSGAQPLEKFEEAVEEASKK